mmetsp:Transcript_105677/g.297235  ORF Transcript_105677/g.297235 Transcript_105677/m.297235 type:complete len:295 (+) Transcript_105677:534-1418(+)
MSRVILIVLVTEHGHQGKIPRILGVVAPRSHVMQEIRWGEQAVALLDCSVAPPRLCEIWPPQQIDALAVDWRIVGAPRATFVWRFVILVPHGDVLALCLQVPHDPLFLPGKNAHNLMIHVVMDRRRAHHARLDSQVPKVVLVQLGHPRPVLHQVTLGALAAVEEAGDVPVLAHVVWHLGDDILCPIRIRGTLLDEIADARSRLHIRDGVPRTMDVATLDLHAAIIGEPVLVSPFDLRHFITEMLHDVFICPIYRRRLKRRPFDDERLPRDGVLLPKRFGRRRLGEDIDLANPRV